MQQQEPKYVTSLQEIDKSDCRIASGLQVVVGLLFSLLLLNDLFSRISQGLRFAVVKTEHLVLRVCIYAFTKSRLDFFIIAQSRWLCQCYWTRQK